MLAAAGRIRKLVTAFVTLDSIPLEPHYRAARERGSLDLTEIDEAMFLWGLHAAANRLPFLPVRAGIGSDVMRVNTGAADGDFAVRRRGDVRGDAGAADGRRPGAHEPRGPAGQRSVPRS
ncbi:hypothetical protein SALBM311S_09245 [Streptomyces alboniger]